MTFKIYRRALKFFLLLNMFNFMIINNINRLSSLLRFLIYYIKKMVFIYYFTRLIIIYFFQNTFKIIELLCKNLFY